MPKRATNVGFSWKIITPKITPKTISSSPSIPAAPASISFNPFTNNHEAITEAIANKSR